MTSRSIVFCATSLDPSAGGIASANGNVREALEKLAGEQRAALKILVLNDPRADTRSLRSFGGNKAAFALHTLIALCRADLVVFDHVQIARPVLWLPKALRAPILVFAHGSEAGKRMRTASRRTFRAASLVLTNSFHTLKTMRRHIRKFQGAACPLGLPPQHELMMRPNMRSLDLVFLTAADGIQRPLGSRVMLLVGRMDAGEREKGHRELVAVMPQLKSSVPDAQLVFAGSGSDEADIRQIAAASPVASNIFVAGKVPQPLLEKLYGVAYSFVMPSRQEGFGLVYLEAMNHAKPCVACRGDGGGEIVAHERTGLLVSQPIDDAELTATLIRLLTDEKAAIQMGVNGWKRLKGHFTAVAYQNRLAGHIRTLMSPSGNLRLAAPGNRSNRSAASSSLDRSQRSDCVDHKNAS